MTMTYQETTHSATFPPVTPPTGFPLDGMCGLCGWDECLPYSPLCQSCEDVFVRLRNEWRKVHEWVVAQHTESNWIIAAPNKLDEWAGMTSNELCVVCGPKPCEADSTLCGPCGHAVADIEPCSCVVGDPCDYARELAELTR